MKQKNKYIAEILLQSRGSDVSKYNESFMSKVIQNRTTETNCSSFEEYCEFLLKDKSEGTNFNNSLQISFSEFFRNPLTFSVLKQIILPTILTKKQKNKRKEIRIWSSACAAGQETYSIAMLMEELKSSTNENIKYRIFATDQCEQQIEEAKKGRFTNTALQNLSLKRINQWFIEQKDYFMVSKELKKNIDFSVFDLFDTNLCCPPDSIYGDFDIVICANLLFYYKDKYIKLILDKAGNSLANDGYLITGETEREILIKNNYNEVYLQSAIFQRKTVRID